MDIYPQDPNSSGIRWYAYSDYGRLRADTKQGMRELISTMRKRKRNGK